MLSRPLLVATAIFALLGSGCSLITGVGAGAGATNYSGTAQDAQGSGTGAMALMLVQKGSQVTGTWLIRFSNVANAGNLSGSMNGNSLTATLASTVPYICALTLNGTVAGSSISGTYATVDCANTDNGSFNLQSAAPGADISGNYSGTQTDSVAGAGTMSASLTQNGVSLGGTYTTTFSNATYAAFNKVGPLYGSVANSQVTIIGVVNPTSNCPFFGVGTLSGTTISGTYQAFLCMKASSGTFTLTHQ